MESRAFKRKIQAYTSLYPDEEARVRHDSQIQQLREAGVGSYPDLLRLLEDRGQPEDLRYSLTQLLGWWGRRRAAPLLLKIFTDESESPTMRIGAGYALAQLGVRRIQKQLLRIFRLHPDEEERYLAGLVLMHAETYRFDLKPLLRVLTNPTESPRNRSSAVEALAQRGQDGARRYRRAVPHLIRLLRYDDVTLRWDVVFALDMLADRRAIPALKRLAATDHRLAPDWEGTHEGVTISQQAQRAIDSIRAVSRERRRAFRQRVLRIGLRWAALWALSKVVWFMALRARSGQRFF